MQELLNNPNEGENLTVIPVSEVEPSPIDAVIQVSISANRMEAYLRAIPPLNGGAAPTYEDYENALALRKVTYGVKTAKMKVLAAIQSIIQTI